jgi:hypothetical protein
MRYILDTDWIINLLAGRQDAKVKIEQLDPAEIVISLVSVAEIYESAFNYTNPEAPNLVPRGLKRLNQFFGLQLGHIPRVVQGATDQIHAGSAIVL